jgi:hypothetical protein
MRRVVRTVADDDIVAEDEVARREVVRAPWSPAQIVALIIGGLLTVMGGVVLARTGFDFGNLDTARTHVMGLEHTAVLGAIELVLGLILVGAGAVPGAPRGTMSFIGVILLLLGIIVAIEPNGTHRALGTTTGHGWFWAILGVILLVSAMASPVIYDADRRATVRRGTLLHR